MTVCSGIYFWDKFWGKVVEGCLWQLMSSSVCQRCMCLCVGRRCPLGGIGADLGPERDSTAAVTKAAVRDCRCSRGNVKDGAL